MKTSEHIGKVYYPPDDHPCHDATTWGMYQVGFMFAVLMLGTAIGFITGWWLT